MTEWYPRCYDSCSDNARPRRSIAASRSRIANLPLASPDDFQISIVVDDGATTMVTESSDHQQQPSTSQLPSAFRLDDLPEHILLAVFNNFEPIDICIRFAPVCRRWHRLAYSSHLWRTLRFEPSSVESSTPNERNQAFANLLPKISSTVQRLIIANSEPNLTITVVMEVMSTTLPAVTVIDLGFFKGLSLSLLDVFIDRLPNVRSLNIEGVNDITDKTMELLSSQSAWPHLEELCVSHCLSLTDDGVEALLVSDKKLQSLSIDGINHISDKCIETLANHQHRSIRRLYLDGAELTDTAIRALTNCTHLNLLSISFSENLTDVSLGYIKQMRQLRHLHLRKGQDFTEVGFRSLFSPNDGLHELQHLNLSECSAINDRCMDSITTCCPNIESLCLSWCWSVTERGLVMIAERLRCLTVMSLLGMDCIRGQSFVDVPELNLYRIRYIDMRQCHMIDDSTVIEMIKRKRDMIVINYYGEILDWRSVTESSSTPTNFDQSIDREYCANRMLRSIMGGCCMTPI